MKTMYTRDEASRIVKIFENTLGEKGIKAFSQDDGTHDSALDDTTYCDLVDGVEHYLVDFLNRHADADEVRVGVLSSRM